MRADYELAHALTTWFLFHPRNHKVCNGCDVKLRFKLPWGKIVPQCGAVLGLTTVIAEAAPYDSHMQVEMPSSTACG
jgi:hypothetical protein